MRHRFVCRLFPAVLSAFVVGTLAGCVPQLVPPRDPVDVEPECVVDEECDTMVGPGAVCQRGRCIREEESSCRIGQCAPLACDPVTRRCTACTAEDAGVGNRPVACPSELTCIAGRCFRPSWVDYDVDIYPLFEAGDCIACHRPEDAGGGLDLSQPPDVLYERIAPPSQGYVDVVRPMDSLLIQKPMREDPPDHPVGVWDPAGPEVDLLREWIEGGAQRTSRCRDLDGIDCFGLLDPDTFCATVLATGSNVLLLCGACDDRFRRAPEGLSTSDCISPEDAGSTDTGE